MDRQRRTPRPTTLSLPSRLVNDMVRLAELMGAPFQVELAVNLGEAIERQTDVDAPDLKAAARALPADETAWERVRLWLPAAQSERLRELAKAKRLSQGKALAALLAPVVDEHLQVATYAVERQVSYLSAHQALADKAGIFPAAPVAPKARRKAPRRKSA
ncbi:hypothetical protein D3C72_756960 [compost metagenome]